MFITTNNEIVQDGAGFLNGRSYGGPVINGMEACRWDGGLRRPFIEDDPNDSLRGQVCCNMATGAYRFDPKLKRHIPEVKKYTLNELHARNIYPPITMNATFLRKEEWIQLDAKILRAARRRLRATADLAAVNSFGGFNGMSKLILEHEVSSDPGEAIVDMNGVTPGRGDTPIFQLRGVPLPITHSDFTYDARLLSVSRNSGTPLDTFMGEAAGRRVAETIEKTLIGNQTGITYGGASTYVGGYDLASSVFGYLNYPNRLSSSAGYSPTGNGRSGTGWTPLDTIKDLLAIRNTLYDNKFYGPYMVYHSTDWDQYMDQDYFTTAGVGTTQGLSTRTLRERLRAIEGIQDVRRLDFLFATSTDPSHGGPGFENVSGSNPFTFILVQMTPDVAEMVNGMDITTLQWETVGGMQLNFKVFCIQVPRLRSDFYGNCGIAILTFTH